MSTIQIIKYSVKSIAVIGNTTNIKEELKELGDDGILISTI